MRFAERLLLTLSRNKEHEDQNNLKTEWTVKQSLKILVSSFPNILDAIIGRDILDFGCGNGYQVVALALSGARSVTGIDTNPRLLSFANILADTHRVMDRVSFINRLSEKERESFDMVISQNSMEHFSQPHEIINQMKVALRPNGTILITFAPPWFSPYGAHMHFFTNVPWVHLLFAEQTVMAVRSRFRNDGATRYEDVEGGLNKMSLKAFERLIGQSGLSVK